MPEHIGIGKKKGERSVFIHMTSQTLGTSTDLTQNLNGCKKKYKHPEKILTLSTTIALFK